MSSLLRLLCATLLVSSTSACAIFAPIFGFDRADRSGSVSVYQSAMADYSLCETAPDPADRAAASARLSQAAAAMAAETRPTNADHFYELDRVTAAEARCRETLQPR
jgi:hypothetical protein